MITEKQPALDTMPLEWVEGDYEDDYCDCPICMGQDEYDGLDDGEAVRDEGMILHQVLLSGELELDALRGLLTRQGDAEVTIDNGYEVVTLNLVDDTLMLSVVGK